MARVSLPQSRVRRQRRRRGAIILAALLAAIIVVVGGLAWLTWAPFMRINTVLVVGAQTLSTTSIAAAVDGQLNGARLGIFSRRAAALYPKSQIIESLLRTNPTIERVEVKAKNLHTIEVSIRERQPKALWCGESSVVSSDCSFVDEVGVVYAPAAEVPADAFKRYFGAASTSTPRQFLTPEEFRSLSALIDALAQSQKTDALVSAAVDGQGDVRAKFASGFELIFTLGSQSADVFERFELAQQSEPFRNRSLSDFLYLDLRFGDKLYYKLK